MSVQVEAADILQIAMRIEENGGNFYRYAVQIAPEEDAKKMFADLAVEEDKHKETFKRMLSGVDRVEPPESFPGEYAAYLRNYTDNNIIFKKEVMDRELAKVKDTVSALEFAIRRELDSILYYHELKNFLPRDQHGAVEEVINEERRHFSRLSKMKEQYGKG
ncbi:MAG TPA: ferritin family protein [Syntrophales bacterium]|nr:ferritin family protein [Syntrophales bacterium]HPX11174.1 ferritin family protein [Syntrophales bacterium]HQN77568.1 ferritin family protein [Syntrophales bacterium]HQQ26524.1 ferritin family protein [Syntrophales bacterium]